MKKDKTKTSNQNKQTRKSESEKRTDGWTDILSVIQGRDGGTRHSGHDRIEWKRSGGKPKSVADKNEKRHLSSREFPS